MFDSIRGGTDVENSSEAFMATLLGGAQARYRKNSIIECSANVSDFGKETRVRVIFQTKILDNFGNPLRTYQVEDDLYYQDFFTKVDKGIFIEKEKL